MMKKIVVLFVLVSLFTMGFGGQMVQATVHPSLYYTQEELVNLRALRTAPSHSAMWDSISSWAAAHVNDPPPDEPTSSSDLKELSVEICHFIDTMVFMYCMTDDTDYADAAKNWMLHIANNWVGWNSGNPGEPNTHRYIAIGFSNGYYSLRDYFTESERITIRDNIVENVLPIYDKYKNYEPANYLDGAFLSRCFTIGTFVGFTALALGEDYANSATWLAFSVEWVNYGLTNGGGSDGGWMSGPSYSMRGSTHRLFRFVDILRRIDGQDLFDTYSGFLSGVPYYFIYTNIEDDHFFGAVPMQMEDTTGSAGYFGDTEDALCFLYKSAKEYGDGYTQMMGNTYAKQDRWLSYIWKDPDLTPLSLSNLPLYRHFEGIGYVTWRTGWGADDLVFLFKSGHSMGHCHPNQNTFVIYKGGRPLTAPPGYAAGGYLDYKVTWPSNCITVGDYTGNPGDGNVYGRGQAHEPGDLSVPEVAMGTRGTIEQVVFDNAVYKYVRGYASALYTGETFTEPSNWDWPGRSSGDLDKWIRHIAFIDDLEYFVIYDDVVSPTPQQINWWYNALDIYNEEGTDGPPDLFLSDNLITHVIGDKRLEIKMLEPAAFNSEIRWERGIYNREFSYILLWPQTEATDTKFLSVMTVDDKLSSGTLVPQNIQQNNCLGVMVDSGDYRDLILFSTDDNHVNEYIELEGYYQAADGNTYTFDGTQVLADFDTYQVMRLALSGTNQPPVLSPIGDKSIGEGELLEFTISATDSNGDPLTYSASNLPSGASFDTGTSTFSWTPGSGQEGSYPNVHFEVTDGELTDAEDITITVNSVNNPPVLTAIGNKSVNEGELIQFTISAIDPDGDSLTCSASNLPSGASFDSGNRTFSWTPSFTQAGSYSNVHFEVTDGELTDTEDITITVSNVKDPPVLGAIGNKSVNEDELLEFTISATDLDGDPLTYSASNLPSGASFDTEDRTFSWTPSSGQEGSYPNVHFEVSDGGLTDTEDITITVTDASYVPPAISFLPPTDDDNATVNRDWTEVNVSVNSTANETSGFIDWDRSLVGYLDFNENTNDKSTYNNEGTLNGAQSTTGKYSNAIRFNSDGDYLLINDSASMDFDKSRGTIELWLYPFDKASGVYQRLVVDSSFWGPESPHTGIELAIQPSGNLYFYPAEAGGNNYNLVTDPLNDNEWQHLVVTWDYSTREVLIYINGVNQSFAEEYVPANWDTIAQTDDWYIGGTSIDTGFGFFNGIIDEVRIWSRTLSEEEIRASYNANIYSLTHTFTNLADGTYQYYAYATDTTGNLAQTETRTLTINTASPNDPPVLTAIGDKSINEGELLQFTISATDPDGDPLTYSASNLPSGASFNTGTRTFSWTPSSGQAGTYSNVHFEVTDSGQTDVEDITITVSSVNPPSGGGGGGGGGGGYVPPVPPQDEAPPELSDVVVSEITTSSVDIVWTTDEESNSQVEYWSSPSNFSPLDETLVTHHVVYLTNLTSGTTYHYRVMSMDEANNLAVSDEYTFTTLVTPANFAVSTLDITPTNVDIGEEVTISVLVANSGDIAGDYEVTLSVDGITEDTKYIADLAGGASLKVTFTTARNAAGTFVVDVNGIITSSFIVEEAVPVVEEVLNTEPEISLFSVTPSYDTETDKLVFTRVIYQVNNSHESMDDVKLTLKVSLNGEPLEEVPLLSSNQMESDGTIGSLDYIPLLGWRSGIYTFRAELDAGGKLYESTVEERLEVMAESEVKVVRWGILGMIIGAMLVVISATIIVVLYRKRHMLTAEVEDR